MHDKILIVDFGSQVTQLIARRVRDERVYCEIAPFQKAEQAFAEMQPKGVILSGGPASVTDPDAPLAPPSLLHAGVPVLGICYGEQVMAQQLGGEVEGGHHREFGRAEVEVTDSCALFDGVWRTGERYPTVLCRAVPPRSHANATRSGAAAQFRSKNCRVPR
jgi:GMP synthase (glutamine-hydrolysing)